MRKRVESLTKSVRQIQTDTELKWIDRAPGNLNILAAGALHLLNGCIVGSTPVTREGQQITVTSVQFRIHMFADSATGQTPTEARVIIFWDKAANHVAPYVDTTTNSLGLLDTNIIAVPLHAPYNYVTSDKYRVIFDKTWDLTGSGWDPNLNMAAGGSINNAVTFSKKISTRRNVKYNAGVTGGIADITTNSLYMLVLGGVNTAHYYMGSRVYFKDN